MKTSTTRSLNLAAAGCALTSILTWGCSAATDDSEQSTRAQSLVSVASAECGATYSILSQWNGGFKAEVTLENKTSSSLDWRGSFQFEGGESVESNWRSQLLSGGEQPVFQGASYNSVVAPGDSVTFGFVGAGVPQEPTGFTLNGMSCSGSEGSSGGDNSPSQPPSEPGDGGSNSDDECDTTNECRDLYGDAATDCVDSQSSESWCACGQSACQDLSSEPPEPDEPEEVCAEGILNGAGTVCCAASCGACGGSGCASRPGGADACCAGRIAESGRSCSGYDAPCSVGEGSGGPSGGGGAPTAPSSIPQPPSSCSNAGLSIPNYVEVHTVIDKSVERPQFPQFDEWYTEQANTQRFQLHQGDTNLANPNIPRPRVEAYAPSGDRWKRTGQNDWHEFSANYYLESWDEPWLYAVFQIKTNDASNFIIQGLIDKDGKLMFARRGKGRVTIDNDVFQKPFHLRVRSNGYRFEVYYNCELVLAENHPQPGLESNNTQYGWRWGLYRQQESGSDFQKGTTTLFVTGPQWD